MKRLAKFLSLEPRKKRFYFGAFLLLVFINFSLKCFSFDRTRRFLNWAAKALRRPPSGRGNFAVEIGMAVSAAARQPFARASCLTQSLAALFLLNCRGEPFDFRFGAIKGDDGRLQAHAWVESRGKIVVGEHGASFTRLEDLK